MPQRPIQHILEDISRKKFESLLPDEWVYRNKDKDYGIDAEVEIFDKNYNAQGLLFFVQLKATDAINPKDILSVSMEVHTLNYYRKIDTPIMLARYSKQNDKMYYRWLNNYDLYNKEEQKTVTIKFSENDMWNENTATKLEQELQNYKYIRNGDLKFPITYSIIIDEKSNKCNSSILKASLRSEIQNEFSDYLLYKQENPLIQIILNDNTLTLNISNVGGSVLNNIDLNENVVELTKKVEMALVMGLFAIKRPDHAGRVLFENQLEYSLFENEQLFLSYINRLLHSSYFQETIKFIEQILKGKVDAKVYFYIKYILLFVTTTKNKTKLAAVENIFNNELEKAQKENDKQQIGIAYYNLGNFYRCRNDYTNALVHYIAAKKNAPIYKKQYYFYSEIGETLYAMNRFRCASSFYKKAIQIKTLPELKVLYADALFYSGEYLQALTMYNEYLDDVNMDAEPENILKQICLTTAIQLTGIESQNRDSNAANMHIEICNSEKDEDIYKLMNESLKSDLLCSDAWFNLGIFEKGDGKTASLYFLIAAITSPGDVEAWCNATLLAYSSTHDISFVILIIKAAHKLNGGLYLTELYARIQNSLENEHANILINVLEVITNREMVDDKNSIQIRMLNEDEIFDNII